MTKPTFDLAVYVITDREIAGNRSIADVVQAAIRGGATMIQLREKTASDSEMLAIGRTIQQMTRAAGIPLIINDRVAIAQELDAEGVHVGQSDMQAYDVRKMLGEDRLLGVSAETIAEARQAEAAGADHLGVGDVYGTLSKADAHTPIGLSGLTTIVEAVTIPVVAIGGITLENAAATIQAGAAGVSVISAIVGAADPEHAARQLRTVIDRARSHNEGGKTNA